MVKTNIHKRIVTELKRRRKATTDQKVRRVIDKELKYEQNVFRNPPQGVWVLTDFGIHIDATNDIAQRLPKRRGLKWQIRDKYEKRGAALINTKIPHILSSLHMRDGGAMTYKILEDLWFTTSSEFYNAMNNLHKNRKSNKTLGYFKELLRWPRLEPIVELKKFKPSPLTFRKFSKDYETFGDIIKLAMKYNFEVDFVRDKCQSYYTIILPETIDKTDTLYYEPHKSQQHCARIELIKLKGLETKLQIGQESIPINPKELGERVADYGKRYLAQRQKEVKAYRQKIRPKRVV